jgi:hypothetical protein
MLRGLRAAKVARAPDLRNPGDDNKAPREREGSRGARGQPGVVKYYQTLIGVIRASSSFTVNSMASAF